MYRYETHLHTYPVSKCAHATVRENLEYYKKQGFDGVFITNHFLDGNINAEHSLTYEKKLEFYFSDYKEGLKIGEEIGLKVFLGCELSHGGTDFLVYGLSEEWYFDHPEIMDMSKREELEFMRENDAFIIQAHPFREASYIDHIRLYPRQVDGVEVINACRTDFENEMARIYAESYGLLMTAGSDNHIASKQTLLAGVEIAKPISCVEDYINAVRENRTKLFISKKASNTAEMRA